MKTSKIAHRGVRILTRQPFEVRNPTQWTRAQHYSTLKSRLLQYHHPAILGEWSMKLHFNTSLNTTLLSWFIY